MYGQVCVFYVPLRLDDTHTDMKAFLPRSWFSPRGKGSTARIEQTTRRLQVKIIFGWLGGSRSVGTLEKKRDLERDVTGPLVSRDKAVEMTIFGLTYF